MNASGSLWQCQPGDGSGASGAPPGARGAAIGAAGPDITAALDELTAATTGSLTEGDYDTSQGTVTVQVGPCDDPACDFPPGSADGVHYSCDPVLPYSYMTCINSGGTCLFAALAANPYHLCGGYGYPDDIVQRECREIGDHRIECAFPNVIDDRVIHCSDAECVNYCTGTSCPSPTSTQIEFCVEMDTVISPDSDGFCENYYRHQDREAGREQCPFVAAAPSCSDLGITSGPVTSGGPPPWPESRCDTEPPFDRPDTTIPACYACVSAWVACLEAADCAFTSQVHGCFYACESDCTGGG